MYLIQMTLFKTLMFDLFYIHESKFFINTTFYLFYLKNYNTSFTFFTYTSFELYYRNV